MIPDPVFDPLLCYFCAWIPLDTIAFNGAGAVLVCDLPHPSCVGLKQRFGALVMP